MLKWTDRDPAESGYYWFTCIGCQDSVVEVEFLLETDPKYMRYGKIAFYFTGSEIITKEVEWRGWKDIKWAGPILKPVEEEEHAKSE